MAFIMPAPYPRILFTLVAGMFGLTVLMQLFSKRKEPRVIPCPHGQIADDCPFHYHRHYRRYLCRTHRSRRRYVDLHCIDTRLSHECQNQHTDNGGHHGTEFIVSAFIYTGWFRKTSALYGITGWLPCPSWLSAHHSAHIWHQRFHTTPSWAFS